MLPKSICVFNHNIVGLAHSWPTWLQYEALPKEVKEEKAGLWDVADLDTPSKAQHFFFKSPNGYFHTSELIEVREGHPLYGQYAFYLPNYSSGGQALAIDSCGGFAIGTFTYA